MLFFTADTHYYHNSVIQYCNRPFSSVEEMNEVLIENHNSVVGKKDDVIHCGDFAFASASKIRDIVGRLNGRIHLVCGNHDRQARKLTDVFVSVRDLYDFKASTFGLPNKQGIVACHYAMRTWNRAHYGIWHVHGHSHGSLPPHGKSWDVGVDNNNFKPISFNELEQIVRDFPLLTHHE